MTRPFLPDIASLDFDTLMALAEQIAVEHADGHFTLMRFTTGWKCIIGTPDFNILGRINGSCEIMRLPSFQSAREALSAFICARR